jgi:hypothetical protein
MAEALTQGCAQHENLFECPDNLIYWSPPLDEYGLIVHDGGRSYVLISTCPWCDRRLPNSKREAWATELEKVGVESPFFDEGPAPFASDAWYRATGDSTCRGEPSPREESAYRFSGSFTIPAPPGWSFRESLTIHGDRETSVTAESDPADGRADSKHYADIHGSQYREELPNYKELSYRPANLLGGRNCWVRTFEWAVDGEDPVTEIQVDYVADGRRYSVTASTPSAHFAAVEHGLMTILERVLIEIGS